MTVFTPASGKIKSRVVREKQTSSTPRLQGFELPLAKLLTVADAYAGPDDDED